MFPTLASVVEERMSYDHELMNAVLHSLNEWLHAEWGFHREERIFTVPFITLMDVEMAVAELEWAIARGARTIGLRPAPVPGYRGSRSPGLPEFDPFWARVQEAGIFVSFHASDSGYDRYVRMWEGGRGEQLGFVHTPMKTCLALLDRAISDTVAALICHGVFDRFPGVRVACIENGGRWVKHLFECFDQACGQQPKEFARHPIETFREHVWVSPFYEEPLDDLAELIGVGQILFGSDYPHPEGLGTPLDYLKELTPFGEEDRRRIMSSNLRATARRGVDAARESTSPPTSREGAISRDSPHRRRLPGPSRIANRRRPDRGSRPRCPSPPPRASSVTAPRNAPSGLPALPASRPDARRSTSGSACSPATRN